MSEQRGDGFERHASVDGLSGQRVPQLMRSDVADAGDASHVGEHPVDASGGNGSVAVHEQQLECTALGR